MNKHVISQAVFQDILDSISSDNPVTVELAGFLVVVPDPPLVIKSRSELILTGGWTLRFFDQGLNIRQFMMSELRNPVTIWFDGDALRIEKPQA